MKGDFNDLLQMEREMIMELGFGKHYNNDISTLPEGDYVDMM